MSFVINNTKISTKSIKINGNIVAVGNFIKVYTTEHYIVAVDFDANNTECCEIYVLDKYGGLMSGHGTMWSNIISVWEFEDALAFHAANEFLVCKILSGKLKSMFYAGDINVNYRDAKYKVMMTDTSSMDKLSEIEKLFIGPWKLASNEYVIINDNFGDSVNRNVYEMSDVMIVCSDD